MSTYVLLNLLNTMRKNGKMPGLPSILSLFLNEFDKFINTGERMLNYHMTLKIILKSFFWCEKLKAFAICMTLKALFHKVS